MLELANTAIAAIGAIVAAWVAARQHQAHKRDREFRDRWGSNGD